MDSDCEQSDDEEEFLVYVEFEGFVERNTFSDENLKLDIIGIDSDYPIIEVNGKFYEGTYEDAVGTYLFFKNDENPIVNDLIFDTVPTLKYFAKTRKLLRMQRVFTAARTDVLGDSTHAQCIPNINTIKEAGVPSKYHDNALSFWTEMRDDRLQALNAYLEKHRIREEKKLQGIQLDSESDEDNPFAIYKSNKTTIPTTNMTMLKEDANSKDIENKLDHESCQSVALPLLHSLQKDRKQFPLENNKNTNVDVNQKIELSQKEECFGLSGAIHSRQSSHKKLDLSTYDVIGKHKGSIKVIKRARGRIGSTNVEKAVKSSRKKQFSETKVVTAECINTGVNNLELSDKSKVEETPLTGEIQTVETKDNVDITNIEDNNQDSLPEACKLTTNTTCMNKRLKKKVKREAKMKEISEQLRKSHQK
ncbi:uncharacterized protein LOC107270853 [Cephus cinctus]|uniref:Uncharacterized protein LOC107270853 n=1 Tax=Cephus cinctus TaxID=211228 RepID=A0AAJ7C4H3_CEPCN|nr:uncharacterized protein LOC107270853 [Cephus cinctus]